jgi:2-iminobutanoate/2-iminopropanoate deaminase
VSSAARTQFLTQDAPAPSGSYSQAIAAGGLLFCAGQGPFAADGSLVSGSIAEQTRQVLQNLDAVARAAGATLADAVRVGVYLSSLDHFDEMDAEYRRHFRDPLPARTTTQTELVGFDVEIDAVIALPR